MGIKRYIGQIKEMLFSSGISEAELEKTKLYCCSMVCPSPEITDKEALFDSRSNDVYHRNGNCAPIGIDSSQNIAVNPPITKVRVLKREKLLEMKLNGLVTQPEGLMTKI
jgi:hypothetical protein